MPAIVHHTIAVTRLCAKTPNPSVESPLRIPAVDRPVKDFGWERLAGSVPNAAPAGRCAGQRQRIGLKRAPLRFMFSMALVSWYSPFSLMSLSIRYCIACCRAGPRAEPFTIGQP